MSRIAIAFAITLGVLFADSQAADHSRPNVVVILTDDQGWGDLSISGNSDLSTPNIDKMARDGASIDRFYVCPVCSPTRAEFLTGRYHARGGVYSTSAGGERLDLDELTIGDTFSAAGYKTGAFGKWHNGMQYPYHPNARGFQEYYGFCSGHWGNYFDAFLEHNGKIVQGEGFIVDDFTNKAMDFIEANKDNPFLVYLPYNTPHSPMQVPDRWWNKFKDKDLKHKPEQAKGKSMNHTLAALAMCENIDWNVGRVLKKLDDLKLADNTIVVYFCDNGPNGARWNGGMKGRKGSTDEGGVRSPCFIRWPAKIKPGTNVTQLGAAIDLLPTLADLVGIPLVSKKPLDGLSLKPLLIPTKADWPDRMIFSKWRNKHSVRTLRYRMDTALRLYDMHSDPGQSADISKQHPEVANRLRTALDNWKKEMANESMGDRPFLIGHPDYEWNQLPIRDAKATGKIKRSNRFPNDSYFLNWVDADDVITWDVEVMADGKFEVEAYYACPKADLGSTIELSFNDAAIQTKVTVANDAPVRGGEHDRFQRVESYIKDFKFMPLGTIDLKKGSGTMTLRALSKPGSQVMEVRLLMLKRVG